MPSLGDYVTKYNPVAGAARGTYSLVTGHPEEALNDVVQGATLGAAGMNADDLGLGKTNTAPLAADVQAARDAGTYNLQNATNFQRRSVPTVTPTSADIRYANQANPVQAPTIAPLQQATANQTRVALAPDAPQARAVTATQGIANAATIDQSRADQARAAQARLLTSVQQAATGTGGPSAAEIQQQRGIDDAIQSQFAFANSARGGNFGGAMRQAGRNVGDIQQHAVNDAALLRAKEIEAARGQAIEAAGQLRSQDINAATSQAGMNQQANIFNAGATTDVSKTNAGLLTDTSRANAQLAAANNQFNAQAANTVGMANTAQANDVSALNATQANQRGLSEAQLQAQIAVGNAERGQQLSQFNTDIYNKNQQFTAQQSLQAQMANIENQLRARGMDDAQVQAYMKNYLETLGIARQGDTSIMATQQADAQRRSEIVGGVLNSASGAATKAVLPKP